MLFIMSILWIDAMLFEGSILWSDAMLFTRSIWWRDVMFLIYGEMICYFKDDIMKKHHVPPCVSFKLLNMLEVMPVLFGVTSAIVGEGGIVKC